MCAAETAKDALKDILIHLQQQVIANLEIHKAHDTFLDFAALQDVSDSCQDRCVLILMQLQQRIITSGPIRNATPPPLKAIGAIPTNRALLDPQYNTASIGRITASNATSPDLPEEVFRPPGKPRSPLPPNRPLTPPHSPDPPVHPSLRNLSQVSIDRSYSNGRASSQRSYSDGRASSQSQYRPSPIPNGGESSQGQYRFSPIPNGRESSQGQNRPLPPPNARDVQNQYRPMATTVTTGGLFGFGKRTKVEPVVEPPENPLVDEYLATAIVDEYGGMDRQSSVSTNRVSLIGSSILEPDPPNINPWPEVYSPRQQFAQHSHQFSQSQNSQQSSPNPSDRTRGSSDTLTRYPTGRPPNMEVLTSNRSIHSINPKDLLPSEMNKYGGFCKGAWRQQIGDRKKAMEERTRPGGMYNAAKYWQCKQCKFEGRLVVVDKKTSRFDMRVFKLVDGVQFRWEFMFKSHVVQKDALPDPTKSCFGCIFCCAEGRGTPTFEGVQAFMEHLTDHRDPLPTGEILYRMNCLVGRQAGVEEDFDINIISRDGGFI